MGTASGLNPYMTIALLLAMTGGVLAVGNWHVVDGLSLYKLSVQLSGKSLKRNAK